MTKVCHFLFFIFNTCVCFAQTPNTFYGLVLTKIINQHTESDTSRLLYCRSTADDKLSVYTVASGVVTEANAYRFTEENNELIFYRKPLLPGQQMADSLRVEFKDKTNTVIINKSDLYMLYPAYYKQFKQEVNVRHSITAFLNLLSDAIGDYPVSDVLPLIRLNPNFDKRIHQATIVTQRSQADMKDTWTCKYYYNRRGLLDSVSVTSKEEMRFSKKIRYTGTDVVKIHTYLNIDSRQTTDLNMTYHATNHSTLKWKESIYETGKERETVFFVTLRAKNLSKKHSIEPSIAEVLEMFKPKRTHKNTNKQND